MANSFTLWVSYDAAKYTAEEDARVNALAAPGACSFTGFGFVQRDIEYQFVHREDAAAARTKLQGAGYDVGQVFEASVEDED